MSEFFATSTPYPTHRILNSCFGAVYSVGVHLGLFRYGSELGAKRAELVKLMQMFVQWIILQLLVINAPDPTHWTLNSSFGAFHSILVHLESFLSCRKLGAKRAELVQLMQKLVPRSHVGIFHNERPVGSQTNVLVRFTVFRCIYDHFVTAWNLMQNILNCCS